MLFALAGLALIMCQLYPALQATLAALSSQDYTSAAGAYLQVHMAGDMRAIDVVNVLIARVAGGRLRLFHKINIPERCAGQRSLAC